MSDEIIENSNEYYEEDDKDYANEAIDVHNYLFQDDNYKDEKPFLSKPNNNATNKNPNMGKIIELENEDEKVHTLFDKINDESLKGKNLLDDQNYEDILRNNINSKNIYINFLISQRLLKFWEYWSFHSNVLVTWICISSFPLFF